MGGKRGRSKSEKWEWARFREGQKKIIVPLSGKLFNTGSSFFCLLKDKKCPLRAIAVDDVSLSLRAPYSVSETRANDKAARKWESGARS